MTTEFQPNTLAFGDLAGLGQWLIGHYRQHLDYNIALATKVRVASITLTLGGTLYTSAPAVAITGGTGGGATAIATVSGGAVNTLTLTSAGFGYSPTDILSVGFTGGGGSGAAATALLAQPVVLPVYPIMSIEGGAGGLKFWQDSHESWHEDVRPYATIQGINLADVDLNNPEQFYQWMDLHNQEHAELDLAFALA